MPDLPSTPANAAVGAVITAGTTYYLSLHTADPGTTGANEVIGGSYVRQAIIFGVASGGLMASTDVQTFNTPTISGNVWIGLCTASTGANFFWGCSNFAAAGPVVANSGLPVFSAGAITALVA